MSSKKVVKAHIDNHVKAEYIVTKENNVVIRNVKPYLQEFKTFAKGRWLGREIIEVLTREFGGHTTDYWYNAVEKGHVRVNGGIVSHSYRFKNSDLFYHRTHRHEPPVFGEVKLVGESENYFAVNKPQSLPMHASGGYRNNTLEYILRNEKLTPDQPPLHIVHRLDRVTSGLVVLAKSKEAAAVISKDIRAKSTKKVYLARVKGKFPLRLNHMRLLDSIDFASVIEEDGDEDNEDTDEVKANKDINKKRDLAEADKEPSSSSAKDEVNDDTKYLKQDRLSYKQLKKAKFEKKHNQTQSQPSSVDPDAYGKGLDIDVNDLPPLVRPPVSPEECGASQRVGYKIETVPSDDGKTSSELIWLQCPIIVQSHRDGVHGCDPEGKQSISSFKSLGYCVKTDTTLVQCNPFTGRTHQLRLHLQFLGNPIANDPCYGGTLFYGDTFRRTQALNLLQTMKQNGSHPLSKVPHFNDEELDGITQQNTSNVSSCSSHSHDAENSTGVVSSSSSLAAEEKNQLDGESDQEYLIRTCRYCRDTNTSKDLEYLLHCDGIWLHALQYTGKDWAFRTEYPEWAQQVLNPVDV